LVLSAFGVTGEPVSPATTFEELLANDTDPAFLVGSVQPMTLRSMVAMLINALPPAERAFVGSIFTTAGDYEYAVPGDDGSRFTWMFGIAARDGPGAVTTCLVNIRSPTSPPN
jgi:hypothetical protein